MTNTSFYIEKIKNALKNTSKEKELYLILDNNLKILRKRYQLYEHEFNSEDIEFLKQINPIKELLIEFEDCIDELEFLDSRDSAENLFYKFNLIAEKLKLYKVSKRVEKEARELRGNLSNYPPKEIKEKNEELRKKIVTLQSKAKNCKYCDIPMVIRESDNGYFWGCSNFPDCWSKFQLSNEDIEFLFE